VRKDQVHDHLMHDDDLGEINKQYNTEALHRVNFIFGSDSKMLD